jgi:hypothetical protein
MATGKTAAERPAAGRATGYPAVAVIPCSGACAAAVAVAGRRFLAAEAPLLPLRDCTLPAGCHCRYRKFPDRREEDAGRRSPPGSIGANWFRGQDQRHGGRRRQDD